jgi:nucleoside-diphosphate-sugar epimerase
MQLCRIQFDFTIHPSSQLFGDHMMQSNVPAKSKVLILGARGRFGLATARAFADAGWDVVAHMRLGAVAPISHPGIRWVNADLSDTQALATAAKDASVVVHALNPAYTHKAWHAQVLPMMDSAIAVASEMNATLMMPGNIYNFGAGMPAVLREDTPQVAQTVKGQIRIAMEQKLRQSGLRGIIIRAGDFFGSGTGTWFDAVSVKDIRKGAFTSPGGLNTATAWAYLPDLAQTFVKLANERASLKSFEVFHFKGRSLTAQHWLDGLTPIAREQGWLSANASVKFKRMPWLAIRLGSLFVPSWAALLEMRYLWDTPHQLDNTRLAQLIGQEPHTPLDQALRQSLTDLGFLSRPAGSATLQAA